MQTGRFSVTLRLRIAVVVLVTAVLVFGTVLYVVAFLRNRPPTIAVKATNGEASLVLQTVGTLGFGAHPDWVSYLAQKPDGSWSHSTDFELPAYSTIHVTVLQYDSQTGLRNPFFANVQGIEGGTMSVDGKQESVIDPATAAHTFAIPDLGVMVPLPGIADNAAKPCSSAPCTENFDHITIEFAFKTGVPGRYRWQCYVPCGAGTLFGNGGPMQTVGYMDGFVQVT
jgi:heme/copper-type cytochrome/quinol oxidase subunit 2